MALTLDTRARCVARPCCKKRALWALPRLYNTTLSTAPRTLSRASDSITVWGGGRNPAVRDRVGYGVREGGRLWSQESQGPTGGIRGQGDAGLSRTCTMISSVSRTTRLASVARFPSTKDSCSISSLVLEGREGAWGVSQSQTTPPAELSPSLSCPRGTGSLELF